MYLSVHEAAARLGKTPRQIRYLIKTGALAATKGAKSWRIDANALPTVQGRVEAQAHIQDAIDTAIDKTGAPRPVHRRRYSLTDMKAFQIGQPLLTECVATLGAEHEASRALREALDLLAQGCHRFERDDKRRAYAASRDAASRAICALYLSGETEAKALAERAEQELMAAFAGLIRRLSGRPRR